MPTIAFRQFDDTSYKTQLVNLIKPLEDNDLARRSPTDTTARGLKPQWDGNTNLAIGYGTDLFVNSPADIRARLSAVGVLYSDPDWLRIETEISRIKTASNTFIGGHQPTTDPANRKAIFNFMDQQGLALGQLLSLPNVITAENLLKLELEARESGFDNLLVSRGIPRDPSTGLAIPLSSERVALMSLYFNNPSLIGTGLTNALKNGDRVTAWSEIRYHSNADGQHTDRRYSESNQFGLFNSGTTQPGSRVEALKVLDFLNQQDSAIRTYEGNHHSIQGVNIEQILQPLKVYIIDNVALEPSQLSNVLYAANAFGSGDTLQGAGGNDLVLGNAGHDILAGGGGNDELQGGVGKDVYIYNSGDGNDTIVDTASDLNGDGQPDGDGLGVVVFDHHMLQGGLKKQNESVYKSLDGQITYQHSGADLIVNGTLTIKDWQEGQFGIRLKDLPNDPEDNPQLPGATRSEYQKVDHYVQVGNLPDGTPIFDPVYAAFFDGNSNNTQSGTPQLGGITPPIGDENNLIFALGGDDQLHGGDGNDSLTAGADNDLVYGDNGGDSLNGDAGNDHLYGEQENDNFIEGTEDALRRLRVKRYSGICGQKQGIQRVVAVLS